MKLNLLFFLFIFCSCSIFIKNIENPLVKKEDYQKNIPEIKTYCSQEIKTQFQFSGSDSKSQETYLKIIQGLRPDFDFIDHLVLWSLLQMQLRPDQATPMSRLQIALRLKGETQYLDFSSEENSHQYPYLYGLEWILKNFKKKSSLASYFSLLEKFPHDQFFVSDPLKNFLSNHTNEIESNDELSAFYFRGNEILKVNETIPRIDFKKILNLYRTHENQQSIILKSSLYPFLTESGKSGECNYDFNLYNNSIFLIDKSIPYSHLFGFASSEDAFLAATSQHLSGIKSFEGTSLFLGSSKTRSTAICFLKENKNSVWMFSNQSRDPGQHLFQLIRYGLTEANSFEKIDRLLRQSRYIFLTDPIRLILESNRGTKEQTQRLLKINLPLYNADKLGNIWSFSTFENQSRFIIDDRNSGEFFCK